MKIILCPVGSLGDIRPLLALGLALSKAGHEIKVCAPPNFKLLFSQKGLKFYPVGFDFQALMEEKAKDVMGNPIKAINTLKKLTSKYITDQFEGLLKVAKDGVDLIIASGLSLAGRSVAELLKVNFRYIYHLPIMYKSIYHAPTISPFQKLPKWMNNIFWKLQKLMLNQLFGKHILKLRQAKNLNKFDNIINYLTDNSILSADNILAPMPNDIKVKYLQTGYWHLNEESELDDELIKFIEKDSAPIYIGFGSMTDRKPEKTKKLLQELINLNKFRFVISKGWAKLGLDDVNNNVFLINDVPHLKLFPKMSIIIHHGGAGTIHTAARSGIPQIIIPHIVDQFFWGQRIYDLKIGPKPINRSNLTLKKLLISIEGVLSNKDIQNNAKKLSDKIKKIDGIKEAIRIIEQI